MKTLASEARRLRWELLPVTATIPYAALIEAQAYGGTSTDTQVAYATVTAVAAAVTGVAVNEKNGDAAVAGGVVCSAAAWATWQCAAGPSAAGIVVAGMGAVLSGIPYWRYLARRRDGHRSEDVRLETARIKLDQARIKAGLQPHGDVIDAEIVNELSGPHEGPHPDPWPGPSNSPRPNDPIPIGRGVSIPIEGGHVKIGGATGGGKSCLVHVIACELTSRPRMRVYGIDCKPGAPALGRYKWAGMTVVTTPEDAKKVLQTAVRTVQRRGDMIAKWTEEAMLSDGELPPETWVPTDAEPWLGIILDELTALAGTDAMDFLDELVRMSRSYGVTLFAATQSLEAATFAVKGRGGGGSRAQYTTSIAFHVDRDGESEKIFGENCVRDGWDAKRLPMKGFMLVRGPGDLAIPKRHLGYYVDNSHTRDHVLSIMSKRGTPLSSGDVQALTIDVEPELPVVDTAVRVDAAKAVTGTLEERARAAVASGGGEWMTTRQVADSMGVAADGTLRSVLSRLRKADAVESDGSGRYRAVRRDLNVVQGPWGV